MTAAPPPPQSFELAAISDDMGKHPPRVTPAHIQAIRAPPGSPQALTDGTEGRDVKLKGFSAEVEQKNVALKTDVMEFEELLETTCEVQLEGVETSRTTLSGRMDASVAAIQHYDEEYRCPSSSYFSRDKLVTLLGLNIDSPYLGTQLNVMKRVAKAARLQDSSPGLLGSPSRGFGTSDDDAVSQRSMASTHTGVSISSLPPEILQVQPRVQELLAHLDQEDAETLEDTRAVQLELSRLLKAMFPPKGDALGFSVTHLHGVAHTDVNKFVKDRLSSTKDQHLEHVAAAVQKREEYQTIQKQVDEGEEVEVPVYQQVIADFMGAQEKALKSSKSRVVQVAMSDLGKDKTDEDNLKTALDRSQETIKTSLVDYRARMNNAVDMVVHDRDLVTTEDDRRKKEHEAAVAAFEARQKDSVEDLRDFSRKQDALWYEIAEKVREMGVLTNQRNAVVKEHLARAEVEHKRRRYYEEYCAVTSKHHDHLGMIESLGTEAKKILDSVEDFFEHMQLRVEEKNFEEGLDDLRGEEYNDFLGLYPAFVEIVNVQLGKTDSRILVTDLNSLFAQHQVKVVEGDQLIGGKKKLQDMRFSNNHLLEALRSSTAQLCEKLQYWEDWFTKVKGFLGEKGPEVEDPAPAAEKFWSAAVETTARDAHEALTAEERVMDDEQKRVEESLQSAEEAEQLLIQKRESSPPKIQWKGAAKKQNPANEAAETQEQGA